MNIITHLSTEQEKRGSFWVWAKPIRGGAVTPSLIDRAHTQNDPWNNLQSACPNGYNTTNMNKIVAQHTYKCQSL